MWLTLNVVLVLIVGALLLYAHIIDIPGNHEVFNYIIVAGAVAVIAIISILAELIVACF